MSQTAIYESLKRFLNLKGFLNSVDAAQPGWTLVQDAAYKGFALHKLGQTPQILPTSLEMVSPTILDDADWMYLGEDNESTPEDEGGREEGSEEESDTDSESKE